jgi:hypothetical protein
MLLWAQNFVPPFSSHFQDVTKRGSKGFTHELDFFTRTHLENPENSWQQFCKLTVPVIYNLTERQSLPFVLLVVPLLLLMPPPRNCMRRTLPTTPLCLDTLYDMPATPVSFVLEPNTEINKIINITSM